MSLIVQTANEQYKHKSCDELRARCEEAVKLLVTAHGVSKDALEQLLCVLRGCITDVAEAWKGLCTTGPMQKAVLALLAMVET